MLINYIPLAKAMPEYSKRDGKDYVCTLGFDQKLGFIRVYPVPKKGIELWTPMRFKAEKNKRDTRAASWKMPEDCRHEEWSVNRNKVQYSKRLNESGRISLINEMRLRASSAISELNKRRESIGFLVVPSFKIYPDTNEKFINTTQIGMFEDVQLADYTKYTKHSRESIFRITFQDEDGLHNLQCNRWDVFETARKYSAAVSVTRFSKPGPHILMLGNYLQHQTSWCVLGMWPVPTQINMFNGS